MTVLFLRVGHVSSLEGRSKTWDAKSALFWNQPSPKKPSLLGVPNNLWAALFKPWKIFTTYPPCIGVMPFFLVNGGNGWVAESSFVFHVQPFFVASVCIKTGELTQGGPEWWATPKKICCHNVLQPSDVSKAKKAPTCAGLACWVPVPENDPISPTLGSLWKKSSTQKKCLIRGWYTLED